MAPFGFALVALGACSSLRVYSNGVVHVGTAVPVTGSNRHRGAEARVAHCGHSGTDHRQRAAEAKQIVAISGSSGRLPSPQHNSPWRQELLVHLPPLRVQMAKRSEGSGSGRSARKPDLRVSFPEKRDEAPAASADQGQDRRREQRPDNEIPEGATAAASEVKERDRRHKRHLAEEKMRGDAAAASADQGRDRRRGRNTAKEETRENATAASAVKGQRCAGGDRRRLSGRVLLSAIATLKLWLR